MLILAFECGLTPGDVSLEPIERTDWIPSRRTLWNLDLGLGALPFFVDEDPVAPQVVQVEEIVSVHNSELVPYETNCLDRFDGFAIFDQTRSRRVIRVAEAIHAKVAVVWMIAPVAAVCVEFFPFRVLHFEPLLSLAVD